MSPDILLEDCPQTLVEVVNNLWTSVSRLQADVMTLKEEVANLKGDLK